jgi:guanylate kinase
MNGKLFIITSPSGGGKGTLIRRVLPEIENLSYSVSYTTRERRTGEVDGVHYNFVTMDKFRELIEREEFLEYAIVHGNFYGTSKTQVEKEVSAGNDIILEIDVQGAENVQRRMPAAVGVFILPPSYEILKNRLTERNTETEEDLRIRLNNAKDEVREVFEFDFVVINEEIESAAEQLKTIILAERSKRDRQITRIRDILNSFENC